MMQCTVYKSKHVCAPVQGYVPTAEAMSQLPARWPPAALLAGLIVDFFFNF